VCRICPVSRYRILGPIGEANIEVDVIVQNVAEDNSTDFTFTVSRGELVGQEAILTRTANELGAREVRADSRIAKVSVVGVGMRSHAGVASQMFEALADVGINIQMITTSEIKISVIIEEKFLELAVRALHSSFELDAEPMEESAA
jgi:aspartate kinase